MARRKTRSQPLAALTSRRRIRSLHAWLGVSAALFACILGISGIALNHTERLGLDDRFVDSVWLLEWYGIEAPLPSASFAVGAHRLTLMADSLFLDAIEVTQGVDQLLGAVRSGSQFVVLLSGELLFIDSDGEVVDRLDTSLGLPAGADGLASDGEDFLVLRDAARFRYEPDSLAFTEAPPGDRTISVAASTAVPADIAAKLKSSFRGHGLSLERLLLDFHSGRLFARTGVWMMDLAAVFLVLLAGTGIFLWSRR